MIDRIGPYLGVASFLLLAVLAVLVILEAREVRRLREWAGRAPERAAEAEAATFAAAEAKGDKPGVEKLRLRERVGNFFGAIGDWFSDVFGPPFRELDRRSPVDPRILLALLVAGVVAAGVLTNGFGLRGGGGESTVTTAVADPGDLKVAVLNGSQEQGVSGVPGLANAVLRQVVKPQGYRAGKVTDAPQSFPKSTVLYAHNHHKDAKALATSIQAKLGKTKTAPMSSDVSAVVGKTPLALVIGVDDAGFASSG